MTRVSSIAHRRCLVALLVLAITAATVTSAVAQPSSDEARSALQTAEARLDELSGEFNLAVDDYNAAQEELEHAKLDVAVAEAELHALRSEHELLADAASLHIRQLHKLGPSVEMTSLFAADDAAAASDRAAMLRRILSSHQTGLESLSATTVSVEAAERRLVANRDAAAEQADVVASRRDHMASVLAEQQEEVDELGVTLASAIDREEAARRAAEEAARRAAAEEARRAREAAAPTPTQASTSRSGSSNTTSDEPAPRPAPAARANADVAVQAALAQIGKPYRWGATGPNAFDCSGLMVYAWAQAGVNLPRTSASQFANLTRVSRSELQPGDLVFAGSPRVHHVGMYIGNGQIVHSPRSGHPVATRSMERSDLRGFGRPG